MWCVQIEFYMNSKWGCFRDAYLQGIYRIIEFYCTYVCMNTDGYKIFVKEYIFVALVISSEYYKFSLRKCVQYFVYSLWKRSLNKYQLIKTFTHTLGQRQLCDAQVTPDAKRNDETDAGHHGHRVAMGHAW